MKTHSYIFMQFCINVCGKTYVHLCAYFSRKNSYTKSAYYNSDIAVQEKLIVSESECNNL